MIFFFFKQKTAYEMRISDWSSDVCSSDLGGAHRIGAVGQRRLREVGRGNELVENLVGLGIAAVLKLLAADHIDGHRAVGNGAVADAAAGDDDRLRRIERPAAGRSLVIGRLAKRRRRSEEHTSELQSLMRIEYAVVCLKQNRN